jgi:DnaJ-class molecular chaperone
MPAERPPVVFARVSLAELPVPSDDFPKEVVIDSLVSKYQASKLPHAKIVEKLDRTVRDSRLAVRFHADTETLCAGCHHQSPLGTRPPPCRACHGETAEATRDKPALKVAYHRQCVGCHIEMGIGKQGCTDCHASKEVQP